MEKSKVYFTKNITGDALIKMYEVLGVKLNGNVAVKLHSGEEGNQNYLRPEFVRPIIDYLCATVVECNTAYDGARNTTEKHKKLMDAHNWTKYFNVDIMDSEDDDLELEIENGKVIKENYVGSHMKNYDSVLVLSHFKGHPMGGYGGALKQLSIGFASSRGKSFIHSAGVIKNQEKLRDNLASQDNIVYINIMCNMSVDCDCCKVAEDPCIKDIGILSSIDPVALDQACIDLVYNSKDEGKSYLIERIESRNGLHTIESAEKLNMGTREYELINID